MPTNCVEEGRPRAGLLAAGTLAELALRSCISGTSVSGCGGSGGIGNCHGHSQRILLSSRCTAKHPLSRRLITGAGFHIGAMGDYGKENTSDVGASADVPELLTVKINNLGTFRGRVGFAFNQFLFYGTGGFAWADNNCRPRCSA